jgi:hypothetical protein
MYCRIEGAESFPARIHRYSQQRNEGNSQRLAKGSWVLRLAIKQNPSFINNAAVTFFILIPIIIL